MRGGGDGGWQGGGGGFGGGRKGGSGGADGGGADGGGTAGGGAAGGGTAVLDLSTVRPVTTAAPMKPPTLSVAQTAKRTGLTNIFFFLNGVFLKKKDAGFPNCCRFVQRCNKCDAV